MSNPLNGPVPTYEEVIALGRERSILDTIGVPNYQEPESYQGSIGIERQIASTMAVSADFLA